MLNFFFYEKPLHCLENHYVNVLSSHRFIMSFVLNNLQFYMQCFVNHCLSFLFWHCIVYHSTYGFWYPLVSSNFFLLKYTILNFRFPMLKNNEDFKIFCFLNFPNHTFQNLNSTRQTQTSGTTYLNQVPVVGLLCLTHFQHYFSYIMAVSFIGEGSRSRSTQKKHLPAACHFQ